ncbi:MOB kinase activator-like 2 [Vigna unguiculata]|uniref:MOB kinase activator-like 2 n=1 Tax=Vigna unguiculata TaxID=3917 RepID=UPI0010167781|nr:MOB kinase activator-like 2 [Vigna unguiculata]
MEHKNSPPMSVPQFGGWDQNEAGAYDYSVVFTQARATKKHQKTNITEIKSINLGSEGGFSNSNDARHHHHHHHHFHHFRSHFQSHGHGHEDSSVMGKRNMLSCINRCIKP